MRPAALRGVALLAAALCAGACRAAEVLTPLYKAGDPILVNAPLASQLVAGYRMYHCLPSGTTAPGFIYAVANASTQGVPQPPPHPAAAAALPAGAVLDIFAHNDENGLPVIDVYNATGEAAAEAQGAGGGGGGGGGGGDPAAPAAPLVGASAGPPGNASAPGAGFRPRGPRLGRVVLDSSAALLLDAPDPERDVPYARYPCWAIQGAVPFWCAWAARVDTEGGARPAACDPAQEWVYAPFFARYVYYSC
eukprot:scaffold15.g4259.t1